MATILFESISPEWIMFSGEVRAVMLPAFEGDMTVMPGHEPTTVMLNPGVIVVTDTQVHGHRAFVRGGFVQITGEGVSVLAKWALPPEERAAQQRSAAKPRPIAAQRPASRPALMQPLPSNLARDVQARNLGNQRQIASRQFAGPASPSSRASRHPSQPSAALSRGGLSGRGLPRRRDGRPGRWAPSLGTASSPAIGLMSSRSVSAGRRD